MAADAVLFIHTYSSPVHTKPLQSTVFDAGGVGLPAILCGKPVAAKGSVVSERVEHTANRSAKFIKRTHSNVFDSNVFEFRFAHLYRLLLLVLYSGTERERERSRRGFDAGGASTHPRRPAGL